MSDDNRTPEMKIRQIASYAEELQQLLGVSMGAEVKIIFFENTAWLGEVFPSILVIQEKGMVLTHSYHGESLDDLLMKMMEGTKEELDAAKNGKARSLP